MMDIKEVNSGLLNLLLANKNSGAAQGSGNGFGDLLAGLDFSAALPTSKTNAADLKDSVKDKDDKPVSLKETAIDRQVADARPDYKADKADKPSAKDEKPQASKDKPAKDDRPAAANDKERPAADNNTSGRGNDVADKKAPAAETVVSQGEASPVEEASDAASADDVAVVTLDALALMGTVTVLNPQTNEMVQVNGAELAQNLAAAGIEEVTLLSSADGAVIVAPAQAEEDVFAGILAEMQPVEAPKTDASVMAQAESQRKAAAGQEAVAEVEDNGDQVVARQASELSEVVGKDRKVKIEVNVKEEKIAATADASLLKNVKAVDDVVAAVMDGEGNNPLLENADNLNGMNASVLNAAKNAAGSASATAPVMTAAAVAESIKAVAADEAAPTVLANASSVAGGELASAARTPAAANSETPSFKDVYKGMGKEVVDQIKVNITKSAVKGVDKIEIQLKPEDLGHIEVKMQIGKDGKLQAHIISSRPETAEILQKEMGNLQKAFSDAGFQTDEGSLSFSFRDDGQAGRDQEKNNLRNFMGDIMEQETALDAVSGDLFAGTAWDGKSALNIRV